MKGSHEHVKRCFCQLRKMCDPGTRAPVLSRFFVSVCLMTLSTVTVHGQPRTGEQLEQSIQMQTVDSYIRSEMAKQNIPAITVSVMKDGRVVYEAGFGLADSANGIKATPNTPFYTASVTKAFTGTALILLKAKHKLDLDKPINAYLYSAKLRSPMWDVSASTVRRVANHTSGLTTYNRKCTVGDSECRASTEAAISRHGIVVWQPGDHFDYSNLGYGVLGAVISNVSGLSFGQFLKQD